MANQQKLTAFQRDVRREVREAILPFWMNRAKDEKHGGFLGELDYRGQPNPGAPKGGVLNARILWTFAHAYLQYGDDAYRNAAERSFTDFVTHFWDPVQGGTYWSVTAEAAPLDTRKLVYGQSFSLYGLVEYYRAFREKDALAKARELFDLIIRHARDTAYGGFLEGYTADWKPLEAEAAMEISSGAAKSMNTHLHLMEAFTNLYRVDPSAEVRTALEECLQLFLDHILNPQTRHFDLFFTREWEKTSDVISFGHDIEGSWLLWEAAEILGDETLLKQVHSASLAMAEAILQEGCHPDGSLLNEAYGDGSLAGERDWWPQAEAVVGFLNAWQLCGEDRYLEASLRTWAWIRANMSDPHTGEWHSQITEDGQVAKVPIADFWKCPYHNSRCCFEVDQRLKDKGIS